MSYNFQAIKDCDQSLFFENQWGYMSRSQSCSHAYLFCVLPHGFPSKRETARSLVVLDRPHDLRSSNFEIAHVITPCLVLHSLELRLLTIIIIIIISIIIIIITHTT